ncbi:MAG: hypothetical protein JWO36_5778 [Myxococcales bacterium]|nr:hypothetical protein [Myxococcales bacterium]
MLLCGIRTVHADPKGDIQAKLKEAMESYDLIEYDAAKKSLNQAIAIAKKSRLEKDPLVARAYLDLGIVAFAVPDLEGAKVSFLSAVQIDPKIQIDAAYKSPELAKLLDEARSEAGGSGGAAAVEVVEPSVDCKSVKGLQHTIIDTAKGGSPLAMEALLASDVKAAKVAIMYRVEGATEFTEAKMTAQGCKYSGSIPARAIKGAVLHYYVAAFDGNGKPIAAKGSAGSPNIIEITAGGAAAVVKDDSENPVGTPKPIVKESSGGSESTSGGEVGGTVEAPHKAPKLLIGLSGGTGFGYVTGTTEGANTVKNCCIGNSWAVITPELGYYVNAQTSVGIAVRLGFPIGANVDGHATLAPAGLLRIRHAFSPGGEGAHVMGQLGAGIVRNTIKLDNPVAGMDTDVVAQGPLLIGGGIGYSKRVSGSVMFVVDLSLLAGLAVIDHLGAAPNETALNSGLSGDLSLGLAFGL